MATIVFNINTTGPVAWSRWLGPGTVLRAREKELIVQWQGLQPLIQDQQQKRMMGSFCNRPTAAVTIVEQRVFVSLCLC